MNVKTTRRTTARKPKSIGQRLPATDKKTIDQLMDECKSSLHHIDKKFVSMQKGADPGTVGSTMAPSDKQLEKINQFTKVDATKDNVVAFPTNAMNDIMDRDDEGFTTETVKQFASLPQPYSPIGKSYMVDHEYQMANAKGRIFDVSTKKIDGAMFLVPEVYIPKTAQHADFIENIDFGINNFVSVGVVIDKQACTICAEPVYRSSFSGWAWCANGHEKGLYYVPGEEEEDSWGWYLPVDPETKGAVKAQVNLSDAIDFYELSQVFLGAQYYAELAKRPDFKGVVKAASAGSGLLIRLDEKEVPGKMPHEPSQLAEARAKFKVETDKDGSARWTDSKGLVWSYDADDNQVSCLGKSATAKTGEGAGEIEERLEGCKAVATDFRNRIAEFQVEGEDDDEDPVAVCEALDATLDEASEAIDNGEIDQADALVNAAEIVCDQLLELLGGEDADDTDVAASVTMGEQTWRIVRAAAEDEDEDEEENDDDEEEEEEEEEPSDEAKSVIAAARKAKLPTDLLLSFKGDNYPDLLKHVGTEVNSLRKRVDKLAPLAKVGEEAVTDAEADAIHWYAVSRRDPKHPDKGANVDLAQKLIARCGGDIALIKELAAEWKADAQKLFGIGNRAVRSTVEVDHNKKETPADLPEQMVGATHGSDAVVQRLHG